MRLVLAECKNRSPYLPARILKAYTEVLSGFNDVYYPGGLNNTLVSQGFVLATSLNVGKMGRM